jgi:hypothetical protein
MHSGMGRLPSIHILWLQIKATSWEAVFGPQVRPANPKQEALSILISDAISAIAYIKSATHQTYWLIQCSVTSVQCMMFGDW